MRKNIGVERTFVIASLVAICAATGAQAARAPSTPAARGHEIARRACAACHAVEPGGESPRATAPAFASVEMRHTASLENRLADLTRLGHYDMPPINLDADQVRDLLAYIASFETR